MVGGISIAFAAALLLATAPADATETSTVRGSKVLLRGCPGSGTKIAAKILNACTNDTFIDTDKHVGCTLGNLGITPSELDVGDMECSKDPDCKYAIIVRDPHAFKRSRKDGFRVVGDLVANAKVWSNWHRAWIDAWAADPDKVGFFKYEHLMTRGTYSDLDECIAGFVDRDIAGAYIARTYMSAIRPHELAAVHEALDAEVVKLFGYTLTNNGSADEL